MRITCALGPYLPVPPLLGGAVEKRSLAICEEFARRGHEVTMISRLFRDLPAEEVVNGVRHMRVLSRDAPASTFGYRLHDILYALRVREVLPPSDITITNSVSLPLLIRRSIAGRIIVDVGRFPKGQMGLYRRVAKLRVGTSALAKAIAEQSPAMAGRVLIVPNALSATFAAATTCRAEDPSTSLRAKEILFVGRIAREKGLDLLIHAFKAVHLHHPSWRLSIVGPWEETQGGDGEAYLNELRTLAGNDIPIAFDGPVFDEVVLRQRYQRAGIFAYTSVAEKGEAFGIAPVEAMACGCPTIVSDLACFRDFVEPTVNGLVFDHRIHGIATLARALEALILDSGLRMRLGAAGKMTANRYTPASIADRYIDAFGVLMQEPAG